VNLVVEHVGVVTTLYSGCDFMMGLFFGENDHWISRPNVWYSMYNFCGAVTVENGWIFTKNRILQCRILNLRGWKLKVENVWTKVSKCAPLRQIWSNKSYGVCASSGVAEKNNKKVRENIHRKLESSKHCVATAPSWLWTKVTHITARFSALYLSSDRFATLDTFSTVLDDRYFMCGKFYDLDDGSGKFQGQSSVINGHSASRKPVRPPVSPASYILH